MGEHESRRHDARQNRRRLLEAARSAIAERGTQAEIKDIADRAGVGVGTFYRNFATKDELIRALIQDVFVEIESALVEGEQMQSPREGLLHLFARAWRLAEEHGALFDALVDAGYEEEGEGSELRTRVRALLRRGVEAGEFRDDVPVEFLADFLDQTMPYVYVHLRRTWGAKDTGAFCDRLLIAALRGEADGR